MKMNITVLLIALLLVNAGCISDTAPQVTQQASQEVQTTSSPPPEHYPETPRPTIAATQAPAK